MNPILAMLVRLIGVLLSYLFVGWIGYTIYLSLRINASGSEQVSHPPITLTIDHEGISQSKQFLTPEVVIGRDPSCEFVIPDETISLRHCNLSYRNRQWWAEDLDSTNGSFVNESQIESPVVLIDGDTLRVGQVYIQIQIP